ncbi:3-isopropylmalate dehydrogenase [Fusibacter sp. JL216-2]|uniref:3-isopropylmalate dehydrogenase n=1 Tax=Fusibacter sp. JL216-2 TaxID=3071453 RepID=UPI003D337F3A
MNMQIAVLPGDGIGPEVTRAAVSVAQAVSNKYKKSIAFKYGDIGGVAIDKSGVPLPTETTQLCQSCDAVLLGAVGGPKWDHVAPEIRPETGLLQLRKELQTFANIRPAKIYGALSGASPLKQDIVSEGIDIHIVRELTGGIYFGDKGEKMRAGVKMAFDEKAYSHQEVERVATIAFEAAKARRGILTSVDKANVLRSSRMWRQVVDQMAKDYPEVTVNHMYVDNAAMQLIINPSQFDVILTANMFGDILSDEAGAITGSIGLLPSASLGADRIGLYEPVHGSAPEIAGQGKANPLAAILSLAMLLRFTGQEDKMANDIEQAVASVLDKGLGTIDIVTDKTHALSTNEMTKAIIEEICR